MIRPKNRTVINRTPPGINLIINSQYGGICMSCGYNYGRRVQISPHAQGGWRHSYCSPDDTDDIETNNEVKDQTQALGVPCPECEVPALEACYKIRGIPSAGRRDVMHLRRWQNSRAFAPAGESVVVSAS